MNIEIWKKRKKELNLTHDELAKLSGISRRTIAGIFSGDPKYESPTLNTITAIEKALGLDNPNDGWSAEERNQGITNNAMINVNADEFELLELYRDLNIEEQKLIKSFIETLLKKKN